MPKQQNTNGAIAEPVPTGRYDASRPDSLDLSDTEKLLVKGIFARLREIQREILDPYNADAVQVNAIIEARLGLPSGAIGTTHQINPHRLRVEAVLVPQESGEP